MWLPDVMTSTPAANRAFAVDSVNPAPPAMFSPFATTKSMPRSSRIPASSRSTAIRPGLPMTSPISRARQAPFGRGGAAFGGAPGRGRPVAARPPVTPPVPALLRVLDGARFADHGDLDLARVGQRLLDLAHDVAREAGRSQIVDLVRSDEDADLAPGLHGKRAIDAGEAVGDRLQVL